MKCLYGVAAVVLMGASAVNASVLKGEAPSQLTTTESKTAPHLLTVASLDRSKCSGSHARMMPQCNN